MARPMSACPLCRHPVSHHAALVDHGGTAVPLLVAGWRGVALVLLAINAPLLCRLAGVTDDWANERLAVFTALAILAAGLGARCLWAAGPGDIDAASGARSGLGAPDGLSDAPVSALAVRRSSHPS